MRTALRERVGSRPACSDADVWRERGLATSSINGRLALMNAPVDIELIKGRQRAEDKRRLAAGEVTPEELQRENAIVQSAADILYVDFSAKGTDEQWARIISDLERD